MKIINLTDPHIDYLRQTNVTFSYLELLISLLNKVPSHLSNMGNNVSETYILGEEKVGVDCS